MKTTGKITLRTPPLLALKAAALLFVQVATVKGLITGTFEVRSLIIPSLGFGAMFWLAMSTLSENGQINRYLQRIGLLPKVDGNSDGSPPPT